MSRILVLEDEADLREEVCHYLSLQGHTVQEAACIDDFWRLHQQSGCDIAIIDRMLPDGDGLEVAKQLHGHPERCGVVVLTARDSPQDRIQGYTEGADHYLAKSLGLDELGAIITSLARRLGLELAWQLDSATWQLTTPRRVRVRLTGLETEFLQALGTQPGQAMSRRQIVEALGKSFASYDPRNLDALVKRLRQKVEAADGSSLPVKTRHGLGYLLSVPLAVSVQSVRAAALPLSVV